ncbi:DUF4097 family beta strand repeat-containing protein [Streptomyces flavofungini]|uniref:Adhesin domain-containing protein n=1 Tax=Streptomyces flavofungini TaxID=68200 RepID=A0ABS0WZP6_9ACTN|nr:DUF4097 family beta strand repeat-containing protein [Streptomyces flavofungini]MBJ3806411.1 hypothetical protein [Streptomyces flavofungini]GHC84766.1 hypothetical protein GCM10010349_69900 [Streptomyces flavofungini]
MPTFDTAKPVYASVILEVGTVRITASDRADTVVDVRPSTASRPADVRAAERTKVEYANGRLVVRGPKERSLFGRGSSVDVEIALPEGSHLEVTTSMADFSTAGRLGECEVKTSAGDIRVDRAGSARLLTGFGEVVVDRTEGPVDVTTASGGVRLGEIGGVAVVKNSNGPTEVGEAAGDLRVKAANGTVTVGRALSDVSVRTANGAIQVGEVVRGSVVLETGMGRIDIGVREGTAAWLDVRTKVGTVRQALGSSEGPGDSGETVQVRGRTGAGDIVIHRA